VGAAERPWQEVHDAVLEAYATRYELVTDTLDPETLARARERAGNPDAPYA
jgi:hypothetical protein